MGSVSDSGSARAMTRRKQADRRAESERGLVQAVADIITEQGVSAATFEAIGARAGYHRSLVTQRFGSKRGLIDQLVEHVQGAFAADDLDERANQLSGLEGLLLLQDSFLTKLGSSKELRTYFMLVASAVSEVSELRDVFSAQHEQGKERWAGLIAKGQGDGSIRSGIDPDAAARMVGGLRVGVAMQLLVDPSMDLDPIRLTALDTLRLGFRA
jgi:AcrR family transcriptional regulator